MQYMIWIKNNPTKYKLDKTIVATADTNNLHKHAKSVVKRRQLFVL